MSYFIISRDILLDYLFKNSKQSIHYRPKTNKISFKIINIVYCKTRWKITPVFVYCYSGARSRQATGMLQRMGYSKVNNIGGIAAYSGKVEK